MHESFLVYRRFLFVKISAGLMLLAFLAYLLHQPIQAPNGGTWLGYTLGTLGAGIILWLTWLGVRKRRYSSNLGTVQGWLSAHVYLGLSLLVIATLHTGLQFGWNVHTLAYVLMCLVIVSGVVGVWTYLRYPTLMSQNRAGASRVAMIEEMQEIDKSALALADEIDREAAKISAVRGGGSSKQKVHQMVLRSVQRSGLSATLWGQLRGSGQAESSLLGTHKSLSDLRGGLGDTGETSVGQTMISDGTGMTQAFDIALLGERLAQTGQAKPLKEQGNLKTEAFMVGELSRTLDAHQAERLRKLMEIMNQKKNLVIRVQQDMQYQALMEIWLYFHVPVTFALLAALAAHILSVFFYW